MEQTDGEILLEMNHVKKSFDGNGVLEDISLTVKKGEVVSIIGPSGSGKSTLLRCATLLEKMDGGELIYLGQTAASEKTDMRPRQNYIRSGNVSDWCSRILTFFPIIR